MVIPLEEEIASLKGKLQEAEETIKAFELSSSSTAPQLIDLAVEDEGGRSPVDGERESEKQLVVDEEEVLPGALQQQGEGALGVKGAVAAKGRKLKVRNRKDVKYATYVSDIHRLSCRDVSQFVFSCGMSG